MTSQQNVPAFEYGENALKVRKFLYDFWSTKGHGPNLRDTHEGVGLSREEIVEAFKELNFGEIVFDLTTQNLCMIKCPPYSAVTTQVQVWIEGRFFAYCGCAMESVGISRTPNMNDREITIESYCACCLQPVTLTWHNGELLSSIPSDPPLVHVSKHPNDWAIPSVWTMCDSMNFVIDAEHAKRYESKQSRTGVLFTLEQAKSFVGAAADHRHWEYDWSTGPLDPPDILNGIKGLGVDTSPWGY
jgi:Alkylmercury lyase